MARNGRIDAKQVYKSLTAPVGVNGNVLAADANSMDITAPLTTALGTAGDGWVAVDVQVAPNLFDHGIVTETTRNRVLVYADKGDKVDDGNGNEVYGRMTEAAWVYTVSFFSMVDGVETAFSAPAATYGFEIPYQFQFHDLPTDAITSIVSKRVQEELAWSSGKFKEAVVIATLNTIPNSSKVISDATQVTVSVNGQDFFVGAANSPVSVTVPNTIAWDASKAFPLDTTDTVEIEYPTNQ